MEPMLRVDNEGVPRIVQKLTWNPGPRYWSADILDGKTYCFDDAHPGCQVFTERVVIEDLGDGYVVSGERVWPECYLDAERAIEQWVLAGPGLQS